MVKLLEGDVVDVNRDLDVEQLRDELRQARQIHRDSARAMLELRRQLAPLYGALQMVFGELDAVAADESSGAASVDARTVKIWEQWKARLGPTVARAIDALLLQPEMTQQQLAIACGISRQHASNIVSKLNTTGLINKNSGRISLKPL